MNNYPIPKLLRASLASFCYWILIRYRQFRPNRTPNHFTFAAALTAIGCLLICHPLANAQSPSPSPPVSPPTTQLLTGSVLQVNNDALTSAQIVNPLREQLSKLAQKTDRDTFVAKAGIVVGRKTFERVYDLLIYQQARKELDKFDNVDRILESFMAEKRNELLSDYGGSLAHAEGELARQGTTVDQELKEIERAMIIESYRQKYFAPSNDITRSQLLRYYRKHREDFVERDMIQFQLIDIRIDRFLPKGVTGDEQRRLAQEYAQQQAQQALQELTDAAEFAEVARKYSHGYRKNYGGLWRPTEPDAIKGQYQPLLAELRKLQIGERTAIVSGQDRFFIAELLDRKDGKTIPFSQAQLEIAPLLRQEKWRKYREELSAELLTKATIGDLDKFVDQTTRSAYDMFRQYKNP